jgi:hypothetical protein
MLALWALIIYTTLRLDSMFETKENAQKRDDEVDMHQMSIYISIS